MSRKVELDVENELTGKAAEIAMWAVMKDLKSFTPRDIWERVEVRQKAIIFYLSLLASSKPKYVRKDKDFEKTRLYHLASDRKTAPHPDYPGRPKGRNAKLQKMWNVMRRLKTFTPRDIVAMANTNETEVTLTTAKNYCSYLLGAGYLSVVEKAKGPTLFARYRLLDNTGPAAPVLRKETMLYDPNDRRTRYVERGR